MKLTKHYLRKLIVEELQGLRTISEGEEDPFATDDAGDEGGDEAEEEAGEDEADPFATDEGGDEEGGGEEEGGDEEADEGEDEDLGATTQDDGPIENLMEKGKKISLDDFQMLKVIGRGSFGKVYLVRHKETEKPFALHVVLGSTKIIETLKCAWKHIQNVCEVVALGAWKHLSKN